jgi:aminoglycoside phosphotransferase (APT) family kinase protein
VNDAGLVETVRDLGLLKPDETAVCEPLSGGVSSDVFLVRGQRGSEFVVKRSIPRLRVRADWRAPVGRDAHEAAWLETVREVDPTLAPRVIARSAPAHLIVMEWRAGVVWKQAMAEGNVDPAFAVRVGAALAKIHKATRARRDIAARFPDPGNFFALRIDPFLLFTGDRHPDVAARIREMAADLQANGTCLIWGDASPKNILIGEQGPVFLDAETAAMGDPAFDLAFCLTHLLLKTIWLASHSADLMLSFNGLRDAYLASSDLDPTLSRRTAGLIGALLLARVDGKSPAGYLNPRQEEVVRRRSKAVLSAADLDLTHLPSFWESLD